MIQNHADELDRFKRDIDLRAYAASIGYRLDKAKSSRNCAVLTNGAGDKIAVTRRPNGHWTYFSVRDDDDNGSIIDFLQHRTGKSLGEVRKALREWTGADSEWALPEMRPLSRDQAGVLREWLASVPVDGRHSFLEARGLGSVLLDPRFVGRIHRDARGNALFPHHDVTGNLTGFERRNQDFKGFSAGGAKSLWWSNADPADTRIVICESPLDCMAYHLLHGDRQTRYVATGGALSPNQLATLRAATERMPGLAIVVATDSDEGGDRIFSAIAGALSTEVSRDTPTTKDWCEMLQVRHRAQWTRPTRSV